MSSRSRISSIPQRGRPLLGWQRIGWYRLAGRGFDWYKPTGRNPWRVQLHFNGGFRCEDVDCRGLDIALVVEASFRA